MTHQEQKLRQLLLKVSKSGRSTQWSHEQSMESHKGGVILSDHYHATIFKRHSCRIDVHFDSNDIEWLMEDINRYVKETGLEWALREEDPF